MSSRGRRTRCWRTRARRTASTGARWATRCLWDGCTIQVMRSGNPDFAKVRRHEALHKVGPIALPRGFVCPGAGCGAAFPTSAEGWACGDAHGVKRKMPPCLWDGCKCAFANAYDCKEHELTHTGVWPFTCPSCGEGNPQEKKAAGHCIVGGACGCGWWVAQGLGPSKIRNKLAAHLKACTQGGTADPTRVGSVGVRTKRS